MRSFLRLFRRTPERHAHRSTPDPVSLGTPEWSSAVELPADFGNHYNAIPRAYDEGEWTRYHKLGTDYASVGTAPHCDARILHSPGECPACDLHPQWQIARLTQQIAFSGHPAPAQGVPCPADAAVAAGLRGDHQRWPGNTPQGYGSAWDDLGPNVTV